MNRTVQQSEFYVGLDLGQVNEPTALAIVECEKPLSDNGAGLNQYAVRHLKRFPAGTPYPDIAADLAAIFREPFLANGVLIADLTAAGQPVLKLLQQAGIKARIVTVYLSAGRDSTRDQGRCYVPKTDLVSTLQVMLQQHRLKVAEALPDTATLVRELTNFRLNVTLASSDPATAWREGSHDDLVFAVGIAVWHGEQNRRLAFRIV